MSQPDDPEPEHLCRNCKFYDAGAEPGYDGTCHRRAPIVTGGMMSSVETLWPALGPDNWCGEFEHRWPMSASQKR